jgi:serine protease Do
MKGILCLALMSAGAALAGAAQVVAAPHETLEDIPNLVDRVKSSVVNVEVITKVSGGASGTPQDLWERLFEGDLRGRNGEAAPRFRRGIGSGFVISKEGLVLTNHHVVEQADNIKVKLVDGRTFEATVLGRDPLTDVALIKLKGVSGELPVVRLGDSDALRVGEWVVAIGNPFGLASSVSAGIVSARARDIGAGPYDDFLQTDAAINPGNSGGPLFNLHGEVVGINTAIVGGASSIGFAVPSALIKQILPQLEKNGSVTRGWLGVGVQDLTPELARALKVPTSNGAVVNEAAPNSPSANAGLKSDDVIVEIDGEKIPSAGALSRKVALKRPGTVSTVVFYRAGKREERKLTWGTRPNTEQAEKQEPSESNGNGQLQGRLGFRLSDLDPNTANQLGVLAEGALITDVTPGSAADRAGLRAGMVIVEANGQKVRRAQELGQLLAAAKSGSEVLLRAQVQGGRTLRVLQVP